MPYIASTVASDRSELNAAVWGTPVSVGPRHPSANWRLAQCVWRRQDDNRAPRPPDPSLRNHRNRQRELAFQTPRLSATPACPGGQTGTSHARRSVAREGTARRPRDPPVRYRDKPAPTPVRGPFWMPSRGPDCVPFDTPVSNRVSAEGKLSATILRLPE